MHILYMHQGFPGDQSATAIKVSSIAAARDVFATWSENVSRTGESSAVLFMCMSDEDWTDGVLEFVDSTSKEHDPVETGPVSAYGCPFDYPDRILSWGPRGGLRIERA